MRLGKAWGSLVFSHNYSESLVERTEYGQNAEDYVVESATLDVQLDMSSKQIYIWILIEFTFYIFTDQQIGTLLYRDIQYAYFDFIEDILKDCDVNPGVGKIPISWHKPIYGDRIPNFTDFAAPGVQLTWVERIFLLIFISTFLFSFQHNFLLVCRSHKWCHVDREK